MATPLAASTVTESKSRRGVILISTVTVGLAFNTLNFTPSSLLFGTVATAAFVASSAAAQAIQPHCSHRLGAGWPAGSGKNLVIVQLPIAVAAVIATGHSSTARPAVLRARSRTPCPMKTLSKVTAQSPSEVTRLPVGIAPDTEVVLLPP